MKIAIIGYSASGKSTLARALGEKYGAEVLHLDTVEFLPCWDIRDTEEKMQMVETFLNTHDSWVIDGNYRKLFYDRRMEEADRIIILLFHRFFCLYRACKRYRRYRNTTRPDMAKGCNEKLDFAFVKWIMWDSRTKAIKNRYRAVAERYADKVTVIHNQKELDILMRAVSDEKVSF